MVLTDKIIRNATPKEKKYKITDENGFYLLVSPSGGKYFLFDYRFGANGKPFLSVLTLKLACKRLGKKQRKQEKFFNRVMILR